MENDDDEEESNSSDTSLPASDEIHVREQTAQESFLIIDEKKFSNFSVSLVIAVLNDCIDELLVLKSVNIKNETDFPDELVSYKSVEEKFMGAEDHSKYRINAVNNNFDKLAKDIHLLISILKSAAEELNLSATFNSLTNSIKTINRMSDEEDGLLEEERRNERLIEELKQQCEEERLENIRTIDETNAKIQKLRFESEDIYIYGSHEVQYFERWEKARNEQNKMVCKEKEDFHGKIIDDMNNKMMLENRCHNEVARYLEEARTDCLDEIQFWMKRYDEELEQRDVDMLNMKTELEKIIEQRKEMQEIYTARQAAIDDFLEYKRIRKEKEDRIELEISMATKIQAWWRGVMFRKKLGPYAKKKKKGKDKGKGKGKGKK